MPLRAGEQVTWIKRGGVCQRVWVGGWGGGGGGGWVCGVRAGEHKTWTETIGVSV